MNRQIATIGAITIVAFVIGIGVGVGYISMNYQGAHDSTLTEAMSTLHITKVMSIGYVETIFHSGTCTQPTVAYSTTTNTYYEVRTMTNTTQAGYIVVIIVSNTTNFTPISTTLVEQNSSCNPLANGTSSSSH